MIYQKPSQNNSPSFDPLIISVSIGLIAVAIFLSVLGWQVYQDKKAESRPLTDAEKSRRDIQSLPDGVYLSDGYHPINR